MLTKKNKFCTVQSVFSSDRTKYQVTVLNAISQEDCFTKINMIIKALADSNELFFGFYRTDGLTLTTKEWERCDKEIPLFFKENGEYKEISEKVTDGNGNIKEYCGYLTVARSKTTEQLYDNMKWIFQYYLETTVFSPEVSFDEFEDSFSNYIHSAGNDYVTKGFTSFLFDYYDSGSFSITIDTRKKDVDYVNSLIKKLFDVDFEIYRIQRTEHYLWHHR